MDCLTQIAVESGHTEPEKLIQSGLQIIKDLAMKNIIQLG
jgi:hypothetical protein